MRIFIVTLAADLVGDTAHALIAYDVHRVVEREEFQLDVDAGAGAEGFIDEALRAAVSAGVACCVRTAVGRTQSARVELGDTGSRRRISLLDSGELLITSPDLLAEPEPMGSEHSRLMHRFGITANAGCGS